jgi:hypothetical protein
VGLSRCVVGADYNGLAPASMVGGVTLSRGDVHAAHGFGGEAARVAMRDD